MNINPKELQKFHDLWAPMIAALPAVINAAERLNELEAHVVTTDKHLAEALDLTAKTVAERNAAIEDGRKALLDLQSEKKRLDAEVKAHAAECKKAVEAARKAKEAAIDSHQQRVASAAAATALAEKELVTRLAEADAVVAARLATASGELMAIEAKKAQAEEALESLRARLV